MSELEHGAVQTSRHYNTGKRALECCVGEFRGLLFYANLTPQNTVLVLPVPSPAPPTDISDVHCMPAKSVMSDSL